MASEIDTLALLARTDEEHVERGRAKRAKTWKKGVLFDLYSSRGVWYILVGRRCIVIGRRYAAESEGFQDCLLYTSDAADE